MGITTLQVTETVTKMQRVLLSRHCRPVACGWARSASHVAPPSKIESKSADGLLMPMASPKEIWPEYNGTPNQGDPTKRAFNYFVMAGARFVGAASARLVVLKALSQMLPAADVKALASLELDISDISEGSTVCVKWRGKPTFVKHRTDAEIETEAAVNISELRDPQTDAERFSNPKWAVCLGVCTHLGCVPLPGEGEYGGWFCPCHGSHYDASGRIRLGPAPLNLEVPQHKIEGDLLVVIG